MAKPSILVFGHRGARWHRAENTMSAFRYALESGADAIELDVLATKDDVLVVTHDPILNKKIFLDPSGKKLTQDIAVRATNWENLQTFDYGVNPEYPKQVTSSKEKIPTLEDVLIWLAKDAKNLFVNIEIKSDPREPHLYMDYLKITAKVIEMIKKYGIQKRCFVQSFDHRVILEAKKLMPDLVTGALIDKDFPSFSNVLEKFKPNFIAPHWMWINRYMVAYLHTLGFKVFAWTANEQEHWEHLVSSKIDGIITDRPKEVIDFLRSKGLR